ncbi:RND family efflux transporter MFP subunit [Algoriphagus sp. 4150]|uniref:efflux RND transporter periplasmic adaptor subunit n=1 Tax=Algoriphagus sp. 4150 TaxID=2817756 RepID=UPI00285FB77E|nr:efflux RND transporter periplasmic adaptor subunit [Algoriphagus sp. 4150]MDR7132672.1 RND family efflux transporter MFP subunit [Algoriphagus sp. 4150]
MNRLILVSVIAALFFSCAEEKKQGQVLDDAKNAFSLRKQEVSKAMQLPAELLPYERAEINAKVQGFVQRILVDIGDKVKKGDLLIVLDAPEVIAQYAETNARTQEAEANFSASKDTYERIQRAAKNEGVVSESEVISTRNRMLADSAAMVSYQSIARASSQLQAYLSIRAPFDGVITKRLVDVGDFVGTVGKSSMLTIERPDKLRLRIYVQESFVNSVPTLDSITFTSESVNDKSFSAKLARKSGSIDPDTRTELWEYEYQNQSGHLKPGMYAMATLELSRPASSFVVPPAAIATTLERKFVIRVTDGKAEWIDVREGISKKDGIEIFGNLNEGDVLLARASEELKSGTEVKTKIVSQ